MEQRLFTAKKDGFIGAWYPLKEKTERAMIVMLGDSSDDHLARSGAKWLHDQGISVMAMSISPEPTPAISSVAELKPQISTETLTPSA